ncbi:MAG: hypothetical protein FMFV1_gp2 [Hangzhou merodon fulcratus virga-like virus 1]|nr:MAG: hypothetical protein FMFV1_gp2 [Hangzhou merodon fulcratus virga-like virus 1]
MARASATRRSARRLFRRSILESIVNAIIRTSAHPFALLLLLFTVAFVASEIISTTGPLEYFDNLLKEELKTTTINKLSKFLLGLLEKLLAFLISHKNFVGAICAYGITPLLRPSHSNIFLFLGSVAFVFSFPSIKILIHFAIALVFWSYSQVDFNQHRFIIVIISIAIVILTNGSPTAGSASAAKKS